MPGRHGAAPQAIAGHTGTDVPLSAGPGAWQFTGTFDNTDVFLKMLRAATGSYPRARAIARLIHRGLMADLSAPRASSRRDPVAARGPAGAARAAAAALAGRALPQALAGKDPRLTPKARSTRPPDYETPVALLDSFITPVDTFYVRSHLPVPTSLDAQAWKLTIDGDVATPLSLSVAELRALPSVTVTVTLECAGNGRAFFTPAVAGIQWKKGAVGTARWTGVRLGDLLEKAGAKSTARFVHMQGADKPLGTMPAFVRQVPMDKAIHPDTVIAYEMNGQPIPPVHGFPLRAIVPGWEGAYAMKWLTTLHVSATETDSFWVATGYRYPVKRVAPGAAVDAKDTAPLTGLVVKSLITTPLEGSSLSPGTMSGRRLRVGRRNRHRVGRHLDRQRRDVEGRAPGRRAAALHLAAFRVHVRGHATRVAPPSSRGPPTPRAWSSRWSRTGIHPATCGTSPTACASR